jgi:hypothetical protein
MQCWKLGWTSANLLIMGFVFVHLGAQAVLVILSVGLVRQRPGRSRFCRAPRVGCSWRACCLLRLRIPVSRVRDRSGYDVASRYTRLGQILAPDCEQQQDSSQ